VQCQLEIRAESIGVPNVRTRRLEIARGERQSVAVHKIHGIDARPVLHVEKVVIDRILRLRVRGIGQQRQQPLLHRDDTGQRLVARKQGLQAHAEELDVMPRLQGQQVELMHQHQLAHAPSREDANDQGEGESQQRSGPGATAPGCETGYTHAFPFLFKVRPGLLIRW
jgi:hypothetical protein